MLTLWSAQISQLLPPTFRYPGPLPVLHAYKIYTLRSSLAGGMQRRPRSLEESSVRLPVWVELMGI